MLFFNYESVYLAAQGDSNLILRYVYDIKGYNFIVKPSILVNKKFNSRTRAEYLGICSLRKYSDYKMYGKTDLDMDFVPLWVPKEIILDNPLVTVTNNLIKFPYEE